MNYSKYITGIIYKTTNNINNKIYIGKYTGNDKYYLGSGLLINRAIKKYGKDNFNRITLFECDNVEKLNIKEKYYIKKFKSTDKSIGYNISCGGDGGDVISNHPNRASIIKKMKKSMTGKKKSFSMRQKLSQSISGDKHHQFNKPRSESTRKKISEALKGDNNPMICNPIAIANHKKAVMKFIGEGNPMFGKHHSDSAKQKIGERSRKLIRTDEHCNKISNSLKKFFKDNTDIRKGKNNPNFGKKVSQKTRRKISESLKKYNKGIK